ncbi:MAG: hypothetical protein QMD61_10665 [Methanobacterium sp.]|nr:hypothetical protein [Methanobacterium sp.]
MLKTRRNVSIPDLRRKQSIINLEQINLQSCVMIGVIISLLVISILCVAAYPNSNMPVNI